MPIYIYPIYIVYRLSIDTTDSIDINVFVIIYHFRYRERNDRCRLINLINLIKIKLFCKKENFQTKKKGKIKSVEPDSNQRPKDRHIN